MVLVRFCLPDPMAIQVAQGPIEAHGKWLGLRPVRHIWAPPSCGYTGDRFWPTDLFGSLCVLQKVVVSDIILE